MAKRMRKPKAPPVVKLEIVPREAPAGGQVDALAVEAYAILDGLIERFHGHLDEAVVLLAWKRGTKTDKDGRLHLGKACRNADLQRQLHGCDWVVLLNREAFGSFTAAQRAALIDHELCHCAAATDKDGNQKLDAQGKRLWRVRKHDVEEFEEVVNRHGLWKTDLAAFHEAALATPAGKGGGKGGAKDAEKNAAKGGAAGEPRRKGGLDAAGSEAAA